LDQTRLPAGRKDRARAEAAFKRGKNRLGSISKQGDRYLRSLGHSPHPLCRTNSDRRIRSEGVGWCGSPEPDWACSQAERGTRIGRHPFSRVWPSLLARADEVIE